MVYNILNGDSLAYSFPGTKIPGEVVVIREALIDGDLSGDTLDELWHSRAKYLGISQVEYDHTVVREFEKVLNAPDNAEFNLWFEYDLFCQVNLWFVLSLLESMPVNKKVFAVHTSHLDKSSKHFWNGFGPASTEELQYCYRNRIVLSEDDVHFGQQLWKAYKINDLEILKNLSIFQSPAFPYLQEVMKAHIDRYPKNGSKGRPERVIQDITQNITTDFHGVFKEFWNRESIYGFGDVQLKRIYDRVMKENGIV